METTFLTRRFFIGGLAGSLVGCMPRAFASMPGSFSEGSANLTLGVLSDIHISFAKGGKSYRRGSGPETLIKAFKWFRDNGVDAVVIAGDSADFGLAGELQSVADAWFSVFPDDRVSNGRHVERIFIFGNHEWSSLGRAMRIFPDKEKCLKHLIAADPRKWWRSIFHEDWTPFFEKVVNGYRFECVHWWSRGRSERYAKGDLRSFYEAKRRLIDPTRPFFHVQHPHPAGTVHGGTVWGQDDGLASEILSSFPNAVAFSGHSHTSLTDDRFIWQGAFTSVGCSSLRNVSLDVPLEGRKYACGMENGKFSDDIDAFKTMDVPPDSHCRQGQIVRVYDDRMVFSRRDFVADAPLGCDIVMPLPAAEKRPFDFNVRRKESIAPEFPSNAKLHVRRSVARIRGGKKIKSKEVDAWQLSIPAANAIRTARAVVYEIVAYGSNNEHMMFAVTDPAFCFPVEDLRSSASLNFNIACNRMDFEVCRFSVRAVSCWGKSSSPVTAFVSGRKQAKKG